LDCHSNCFYCSWDIHLVKPERKKAYINAEVWAEGINRRKRDTILAGGEPLLYPQINRLVKLLNPGYKIEIYTNLMHPISGIIKNANRIYRFLVSCHSLKDFDIWSNRAERLIYNGFSVRFHIVKQGDWAEIKNHILAKEWGRNITVCDDQRSGIKSSHKIYPPVHCTSNMYVYGPDGYRHMCIHDLIRGINRFEHISGEDSTDELANKHCAEFGFCTGCDNNFEGVCIAEDESI